MLSPDLLKKVRRIEFQTRRWVTNVMSGRYRTHFKGQGMQFAEHRLYAPGDDVRHIDWKVSARSQEPYIKKYEEERELTVLLIVDVSGSEWFGSTSRLKSEVVAEVGGMLAFAATLTGDKIGAILFAGEIEELIPPRKSRAHVQRIIKSLLTHKPRTLGTNLSAALESARRVMKHNGIVFIVSDFLAKDYSNELKRLSRKHDVIALKIQDPRETEIPKLGKILLTDPETGQEAYVDTSSYLFQQWWAKAKLDTESEFTEVCELKLHWFHKPELIRSTKS